MKKNEWLKLGHNLRNGNYLCLVETLVDKINILGFIDMLAVFIKQKHVKAKRVQNV